MTSQRSDVLKRRLSAVAVAVLIDRLTPEPSNRWHPVAWFGQTMTALEGRIWNDRRSSGVAYTASGVAIGAVSGCILHSPTAALTVALGAGSLRRTASDIGELLVSNDLQSARQQLPSLVGRDPSELDESGVAAAVVESLAENSVDATVAAIWWTVVAGAPGALAYRAVNTMDAMVGHRGDRYEHFGWASARFDDLANWIPARLFATAVAMASWDRRSQILQAIRTQAPAHPSPNAGVAESAVAAALGVQLGGTLRYGRRVEQRPLLGDGPRPTAASIESANRLVDRALLALGCSALLVVAANFIFDRVINRSSVRHGGRR